MDNYSPEIKNKTGKNSQHWLIMHSLSREAQRSIRDSVPMVFNNGLHLSQLANKRCPRYDQFCAELDLTQSIGLLLLLLSIWQTSSKLSSRKIFTMQFNICPQHSLQQMRLIPLPAADTENAVFTHSQSWFIFSKLPVQCKHVKSLPSHTGRCHTGRCWPWFLSPSDSHHTAYALQDHGYEASVSCACSYPSYCRYQVIMNGDSTWVWTTCLMYVVQQHSSRSLNPPPVSLKS